jgi:ceramide glucosyltransferase
LVAAAGGIAILAAEVAEDAAATKAVRGMGKRAVLVDAPFGQPLGERTLKQVWDRQTRWSRLRRITFPGYFAAEALTGSLLPAAALACCAESIDLSPASAAGAVVALFFAAEALLARAAGWQLAPSSPLAWALRDLMLPALWVHGWLSEGYTWRGSEIRTSASGA